MLKIHEAKTKTDFQKIIELELKAREEDMQNGNMVMELGEFNPDFFENFPSGYFLFYFDEKIMGYARLFANPNFQRALHRYNLGPFFIEKNFRGKGFGQKFLNLLLQKISEGKEKNSINICLVVSENNVSAIKLYKNCGFETFGFEKNHLFFNSKFQNAFYMQKIL